MEVDWLSGQREGQSQGSHSKILLWTTEWLCIPFIEIRDISYI